MVRFLIEQTLWPAGWRAARIRCNPDPGVRRTRDNALRLHTSLALPPWATQSSLPPRS